LQAKWQESGTPAVSEEANVADADEAFGKQMQEEAVQELRVPGSYNHPTGGPRLGPQSLTGQYNDSSSAWESANGIIALFS
jgi:hypothetical protein